MDRQRRRAAQPHRDGRRQVYRPSKGGRTCGAGKDTKKGKSKSCLIPTKRPSGRFILLIAVSVLLSLISALSPTSLISLCEVKPGGNQQGAFHLRLTAIDSQARSGMFNPNAIVCDFPLPPCLVSLLSALWSARKIKSRRTRETLRRQG